MQKSRRTGTENQAHLMQTIPLGISILMGEALNRIIKKHLNITQAQGKIHSQK